ncbi:MAG TPA: helix-turn-helix domain-containing protein, partial [Candidatus Onthocola stercorigallinarum]|nr:helix-turn-helix domain-containing protein [Candidatus Onthocola stercorigallinarum]
MTYKQLNKEQREVIQILINKKEDFTTIGNSINVDRTTISKEIRRNRYIKSSYYEPFDFNGINKAVNDCKILQHPPYVCNTCPLKNTCNKHKLYYDARIAHEHYEELKSYSRSGIDITPETIEEIENSIVPLIKDKHQSINQIYANHDDLIYFSKPTFYKYIDMGVFSLTNLDLPKKVKYKKRRR